MSVINEFDINNDSDCKDEMVKKLLSKKLNGATSYLTFKAEVVFTLLRQAFIKALILQHFDLKCHI